MQNGHINIESIRHLVKESLDRLNSKNVTDSVQNDSLAGKEIESARMLLEILLRDYLR